MACRAETGRLAKILQSFETSEISSMDSHNLFQLFFFGNHKVPIGLLKLLVKLPVG